MATTRRGLVIGSTGKPGGLAADLARCPVFVFIYLFIFCLPNVPKLSFPIVAFPNKSKINHKSVSLDWQRRASRLFLASKMAFEQSRCAGLKEGEEMARRNS